MKNDRIVLEGWIAGVGFATGDRFVIGLWKSGPLGAMNDVMWAHPDGTRTLLAPTKSVADFIDGIYSFDDVRVVNFEVHQSDRGFTASAGPLRLNVRGGDPYRLFALRPRKLRRSLAWVRIEDLFVRRVVGRVVLRGAEGVRAFGRTDTGIKEWYRIDWYRPVVAARATLDGRDLGPVAPLTPAMSFGFSEFPRRPAIVGCSPVLDLPWRRQ